jgi:pimeloyl-ACP methyl ester carboxylesterase
VLRTSLLGWVGAGFTNARGARSRFASGWAAARRRQSQPIRLEALEDRRLLATIVVNSAADKLFQAPTATVQVLKDPMAMISLRDAIDIANNTGGSNTIVLQAFQTYKLDQIDNYWYGPDGLPAISSNITIEGNGATIARVGDTKFRFFYVSSQRYGGLNTGSLTLQGLTLESGYAQGGKSYYGGGGLGAGGAIFNQGTLVLDSVLLVGNIAHGGSGGWNTSSTLGAGIGQNGQDASPGGFGGALPGASPDFQNGGGATREGQGASATLAAGFGGGGGEAVLTNGGFGGGGGGQVSTGNPGTGGFGGGDGGSKLGAGGAGLGGAIFNRGGSVTVVNSTLTQNDADGGDGRRFSFYGRSGGGSGFGGAILNLNGSLVLTNDTIAQNSVDWGTGPGGRRDGYQVYNLADSLDGKTTATANLTLANTILAGAPSGGHDLVNQTFANATKNQASIANVSGVDTKTNIISTEIVNLDGKFAPGGAGVVSVSYRKVDPQLEDLNNNGGWSLTMALKPDSPAKDNGSVAVGNQQYDQRGAPYERTFGGQVDIGAFETQQYQQYPAIARLACYNAASGLFLPLQSEHSITNSDTTAANVYVIAHGWMPGYNKWVDTAEDKGNLPLSWQTWQGPDTADAPSTPWLYDKGETGDPAFAINDKGLAQAILQVDPHATVLAYSWIDESVTKNYLGYIPQDGFHSEAYTALNGMRMADAIMEALAPNYDAGLGKVHLIGHSHGARVATVAALTLQQAALKNPQDNVVRQLTLLDSPEYRVSTTTLDKNPVAIDAANFDWFYLAQLNIAAPPITLSGTVVNIVNGQTTLAVPSTTGLAPTMGVTGPGVPAGTTITGFGAMPDQIILSAAVAVPSAAPKPIELGFWNWSKDAIFVDNYVSHYGTDYSNVTLDKTFPENNTKSLANVVDVNLNPDQVFRNTLFNLAAKHEYAANWYAGSASPPNTSQEERVGLLWSPLISGSSLPPEKPSQQGWSSVKPGQQFVLTPQDPAPTKVQPTFDAVMLAADTGCCHGHVIEARLTKGVGTVTLDDQTPTFNGYLDKESSAVVGFSFDYSFTGGSSDGAELQIRIGDGLYFDMTASAAAGPPGAGPLSATFGLGMESPGDHKIQIRLVENKGSTGGTSTSVTVRDFHEFSLG